MIHSVDHWIIGFHTMVKDAELPDILRPRVVQVAAYRAGTRCANIYRTLL